MLWALVIFLGLQLVMQGFSGPTDTRKSEQILAELKTANAELRDLTAAKLFRVYEKKVREEDQAAKKPAAETTQRVLQGLVLLVDTQFKAGVVRNETSRVNMGYMALYAQQRKLQGTPEWKASYPIERPKAPVTAERFPRTSWSPEVLYNEITKDLAKRYESASILGLFPGTGWKFIDTLVAATGRNPSFSYALAALFLAIFVRTLVWPLAKRQLVWSRQMQQLQPMVKELLEANAPKGQEAAYRSSPEFQQKVMGLYRDYGINPMAGCLPILAQMPLFLIIYQCMVYYRFEFKQGTFLWINPSLAESTGGFIARSLGDMDATLIVLYGISMIVTYLLMPVSDPTQVKQQRIIGIAITIFFTVTLFFWPVPSAFVLYWTFTNILGSTQTLLAYRQPIPPLVKVNAPHGAVLPVSPNGKGTAVVEPKLFESTGAPRQVKSKKKKK